MKSSKKVAYVNSHKILLSKLFDRYNIKKKVSKDTLVFLLQKGNSL